MTEQQAQDQLNILYDGDINTPDSSDEDYLTRRGLLNAGINIWENYGNTLWNELYKSLANASDGDKVTTTAKVYDCPSNFVNINGYVNIIDTDGKSTYYKQIQPYESEVYKARVGQSNYFFVTGDGSTGHQINLSNEQTPGYTIEYNYYSTATNLANTTDKLEMSDPYFAIYYALSRMYHIDGESGKAVEIMSLAESKLVTMKKRNGMLGYYQRNSINDRDFETGLSGFGL